MKAVQIDESGSGLSVVDLPDPIPADGEVLLDVKFCGICGSDLHILASGSAKGLVMGHEFTAEVAGVGSGVGEWSVGDRVTVLPMVACGECLACRTGHPNLCENGLSNGPGLGRAGAYAELVAVPAGMLRHLPDEVKDTDGALAEPLAVALRGVNQADTSSDDIVCILGGGPIGVMTAVGLMARGHEKLVLVEPIAGRRDVIAKLGVATVPADAAHDTVPEQLGGDPAVVIDCTGHVSGVPLALELIAPGGRLSVVGIPSHVAEVSVITLAMKEVTIRGSLAYSAEDFQEAIDHIAAGRVFADEVITSVVDLDHAAAAVADLTSGATEQVKVLLRA